MSENLAAGGNSFRRGAGALAAVVALGAAAKYGPDACGATLDQVAEWTTDESQIVAGVPGQVEDYDKDRDWTGKTFVWSYYLAVEQCPADVAAAEEGIPTQSFNPEVGVINPGCSFDWVKVGPGTYGSAAVGSVIVFEGNVGEHLRK